MLTVKQLITLTKSHRAVLLDNSQRVSIAFSKAYEGQDPRGYYRGIPGTARTNAKGKKPHKFEIRLYYPPGKKYIPEKLRKPEDKYTGPVRAPLFTLDTKVWVSCDCEYFLYHAEVANAEQDNASIKYSNGKGPKITNPGHIAHLCKHLLAALRKGALLKKST